jgi:hypothetical protein
VITKDSLVNETLKFRFGDPQNQETSFIGTLKKTFGASVVA